MKFLYLALYAAAALHLWHYYPLLPEKMATHFDADGQANGWMSREAFACFYIGLLLCTSGIFLVISKVIAKLPPRMVNIPNKDYWLAPERAATTLASYAHDLGMIGLFIGGFIIGLHQMLISMSLDGTKKLDTQELFIWLGIFVAVMVLFILRTLLRFRKPDDVK